MSARFDRATLRAIPPGVWALGFVSMLMDISSEMIHALLPVYLVTALAASATMVGLIEGVAEATAAWTKVFSGAVSDWFGRRKPLAVLGYGLAALTKPIFPLAPSVAWFFAARFLDRVGKGIRVAPRDALVADLAPEPLRGASFGLRQSLDTVGAFLGPLIAIGLMALSAGDVRAVFWAAVVPGVLALGLIVFAVREPARSARPRLLRFPLHRTELARLPRAYWLVVGVATLFTLARFSEAFLVLRAHQVGLAATWVPAVLVWMNLVYALAAYPAGVLTDRSGHRYGVLVAGFATLIAADLVLALVPGIAGVAGGVLLWGLHMGLTQGALAALVADTAPATLRGTAFGLFNLLTGLALLLGSALAGALWDRYGAPATFLAGAGLAGAAWLALALLPARKSR
ncbi:MAG: MFS transporter [Gammaproteobacteria bacterium]|nr:MFS transporter [Gammaproteobacteria bacterium]